MSINVVDLPEELIHEILLRLPVKALLRCKCICKDWCALIGSRSFIDGHYGHESNPDCLLFRFYPSDTQNLGIQFTMYPDDGRPLRFDASDCLSQFPTNVCSLLGPANGIFCAMTQEPKHAYGVLFNPSTRKFKCLPPLIQIHQWTPLMFGFGFDPFSGDYKVVAFPKNSYKSFLFVYNLSSDSWRKIEGVDSLAARPRVVVAAGRAHHHVVLNGVFHWLQVFDDEDYVFHYRSIIAFDMRTENFGEELLVPDAVRDAKPKLHEVHMTTYGDSIALLSGRRRCHGENVDIYLWVMGRDGLWTKSFRFAFDIPNPNTILSPLCVWNKNELLLQTLERVTSAPFECHVSSQKLRKFGPEVNRRFVSGVFSYKESLVSIKGESSIDQTLWLFHMLTSYY